MATTLELSVYDYVVIAATLAVPLGFGAYLAIRGRKNNTKEEYLLGGRSRHPFPVMLSLFVTFMSATSLIGIPAKTFTTGLDFFLFVMSTSASYPIALITVVPVMHALQVTSMYGLTLGFLGACGGPVLGVFSLGALIPWTNKIGALSGLVASLVVNMWPSIGAALYGLKPIPLPPAPGNSCAVLYPTDVNGLNISTTSPTVLNVASTTVSPSNVIPNDGHPFYDISYQYYGLTGWLAAFVVGLLISLVTYRMYPPITDERLLIPIARPIWNFMRNQDSHKEGKEKPATQQYPSHTSSMPPKPERQPDSEDGHVWSIRL